MRLTLSLAKRFLLSRSSDGFLSFIAWFSVLGVSLGVMALVIVTSVINGFEGELMRVVTGMNGDVLLYSRGDPLKDPHQIEKDIRKIVPETQAISRSFVLELMVAGPKNVTGAVLEGIESDSIGLVTDIPKGIISGRLPVLENEIAIGAAVAEKLGAEEGTELRLIIPFTGETDSAPRSVKAKVVGIFRMGMYEYDSKFILMALDAVQKFLDQPGKVTSFNIKLSPGANTRRASDRLAETFGYPFRAKDWSQLNKNLFYAIQLEKAVIATILTVIVIVAAFNVVSTLMMMIHDKTREIAILKAMGFRRWQSFRLFCLIGLGIGTVGIGFGVAMGLGMGWVLKQTQWIQLPPDIYYIGFLPVVVRWSEVGLIAFSALMISFAATLYPSWNVSSRSPLDGLRYD